MQIKLTIAYEGTKYLGWQKNPEGPSIEEELEKALSLILQYPVNLAAASRTDRGVHASAQIATFHTSRPAQLSKWLLSLNQLTPPDISILSIEIVPESFHPTLSALKKRYRYNLTTSSFQFPQKRLFEWHYPVPLNLNLMHTAKNYLIGTHDFKALSNRKKNEEYASHIRTIDLIEIIQDGPDYQILFEGNSFLYKMVRNLTGLIVYAGTEKICPHTIPALLAKQDRRDSAITAPAHGLTLEKVFYE